MSSRDRVLTVTQRGTPDRIPHFEWGFDKPIIKALTNGGDYEDLIDLYDIDAVLAGADYRRKPIDKDLTLDEWGITQAKGMMEHTIPVDELAPIKTWSDLKGWNPPDPDTPNRLDSFKRLVDRFKGKRAIFIYVRDVWSYPRDLMGYMELCVACIENPELVEAVVQKGLEHSIRIAELAAGLGAELIFTGDDIADNRTTLISPEMWDEIFAPNFKKLSDAFHNFGLYHWKHSDGNIMPVLDSLVDAGIDGIDPIDPLAKMDLSAIKSQYGDRIAIKGNVDCVNTLVNGPQQAVVREVKDCILAAGKGGGYVCSSSNSIHAGVDPRLYKTMVETIHVYGTYPLDLERLSTEE